MQREKVEVNEIRSLREEAERLEDLIDFAYIQIDNEADEDKIKELQGRITEWRLLSEELEDQIELSYWKLDQIGHSQQIC